MGMLCTMNRFEMYLVPDESEDVEGDEGGSSLSSLLSLTRWNRSRACPFIYHDFLFLHSLLLLLQPGQGI